MFIKNKIVIVDHSKKKSNFFCKVCNFPLIDYLDFEKNEKYDCCNECFMTYVESRKNEWNNGWRPSKRKVEEYIYKRKKIANRRNDEF